MKLKSIKKKIWSIVIIITTLIGILPVQANTTETPVKDVELDGRWDDPIRSAATNCPITVFTDGYLLTLKNASPDRDMTIRITDMAKGGVVYENDIPEVQSAYITISIANFPAEEYKLEITGTPSGHLTGYQEGKAAGLRYFAERGFREDTIRKFQLGYRLVSPSS